MPFPPFLMVAWSFLTSKVGLYLLAAAAAGILFWRVHHDIYQSGYVDGSADVQKDWDADKAKRLAAYTQMTTKWVTAQQALEAKQRALEASQRGRIDDAKKRAHNLPAADAGLRFPGNAASVLDDAGDSAAVARPAPQPAASAAPAPQDSTVGLVTEWGVGVIGEYNVCRDEVIGWQTFYQSLRDAQGKQEASP